MAATERTRAQDDARAATSDPPGTSPPLRTRHSAGEFEQLVAPSGQTPVELAPEARRFRERFPPDSIRQQTHPHGFRLGHAHLGRSTGSDEGRAALMSGAPQVSDPVRDTLRDRKKRNRLKWEPSPRVRGLLRHLTQKALADLVVPASTGLPPWACRSWGREESRQALEPPATSCSTQWTASAAGSRRRSAGVAQTALPPPAGGHSVPSSAGPGGWRTGRGGWRRAAGTPQPCGSRLTSSHSPLSTLRLCQAAAERISRSRPVAVSARSGTG
jgi:hypothetical protein